MLGKPGLAGQSVPDRNDKRLIKLIFYRTVVMSGRDNDKSCDLSRHV